MEYISIVKYLSKNYPLGVWNEQYHYLQLQERAVGGDGYYALVFKTCNLDMTTIDDVEISTEMLKDDKAVVRRLANLIRFEHNNDVRCVVWDGLSGLLAKVREVCKQTHWRV